MRTKDVLRIYEKASGQRVNFSKSSVGFTPNVDPYMQQFIQCSLGVKGDSGSNKYLGFLPSHVERNKKVTFNYLRATLQKSYNCGKGIVSL